MAVEEVISDSSGIFPNTYRTAPPPPNNHVSTLCLLTEIKDMFFGLQLELRICWSRVQRPFQSQLRKMKFPFYLVPCPGSTLTLRALLSEKRLSLATTSPWLWRADRVTSAGGSMKDSWRAIPCCGMGAGRSQTCMLR